jgi:hypothetical protein
MRIMAGDWIMVDKITPDKPEIAILARKLGCSIGDAFLAFFRLYAWADGVTTDGFVPFLSRCDGDRYAGREGTCEALASKEINWMVISENGLQFVNFEDHNGKSAKARGLEAKKKRRQRLNVPNVSPVHRDNIGTTSGPEKRREEKNINTPLTPKGEDGCPKDFFPKTSEKKPKSDEPESESFIRFWTSWPSHFRKENRNGCLKHWRSANLDAEVGAILSGLDAAKRSPEWAKEGGQYIPHPLVWLHQRRWEPFMSIQQPLSTSRPPGSYINPI